LVRRRLKNPAGAHFSSFSKSYVDVDRSTYDVRGRVDGTNSFGATLRQRFHCRMHLSDDGKRWTSEGIDQD
jgi:hypothetical protein